jgi:hypothetical protein
MHRVLAALRDGVQGATLNEIAPSALLNVYLSADNHASVVAVIRRQLLLASYVDLTLLLL